MAGIFTGQSAYPWGEASLMNNCWNKAEIIGKGAGTVLVGGISASSCSKIVNCYNEGNIINEQCSSTDRVGGISGDNITTVEGCYNTGNITGKGYVGGIASGASTVRKCYNTGIVELTVTGNSIRRAGGILGTGATTIENCFNIGNVTAPGNSYAGGICGTDVQEIYNCYNTGSVEGNYVGGLCNTVGKKMINCYNTGGLTGNSIRWSSSCNKNRCDNRKLL